jgi:hypothetical protein
MDRRQDAGADARGGDAQGGTRGVVVERLTIWLSGLPIGLAALLIVAIPTTTVMIMTFVVRRTFGLNRLESNNEVAGFKYAVLGVIYAVLLGFAVIVVWENFRDGAGAVIKEASALSTIFRLADGVGPSAAEPIRAAALHYGDVVVKEEGPILAKGGRVSSDATKALSALYAAVLTANPTTLEQSDAYQTLLTALTTLSDGRRDRLELGGSTVPNVVWIALFGGAILNVVFTLFFGTRHIWVQMVMSGMLTAVIFIGLFAIIMIDHPFSGSVRLSMEPIEYALKTVGEQP